MMPQAVAHAYQAVIFNFPCQYSCKTGNMSMAHLYMHLSTEMIEKTITDLMLVVFQSDCWTLLSGLCLYCLMKPEQLWLPVASAFVCTSPQDAHPNNLILKESTVLQTYRMFIGWIDSYISLCVIGTNICIQAHRIFCGLPKRSTGCSGDYTREHEESTVQHLIRPKPAFCGLTISYLY